MTHEVRPQGEGQEPRVYLSGRANFIEVAYLISPQLSTESKFELPTIVTVREKRQDAVLTHEVRPQGEGQEPRVYLSGRAIICKKPQDFANP